MTEDQGQHAAGGWLPPQSPGGPDPGTHPPPAQPPPQPHWGAPGYGQGPPPYGQSPYGQGSPWTSTYYYAQVEPDNPSGLAGFIVSITSIGVLFVYLGILAPLTLALSIAGLIVSRKGIRKVESGETRKHAGLAKAGFWLGIAGIVLSLLAIAGWVALIVLEDGGRDGGFDSDDGDPVRLLLHSGTALARAGAALLV
jgi:hypothetical protein